MKEVSFHRDGYPRPQFVRDSFYDLNGAWDFIFDDERQGEKEAWFLKKPAKTRSILVPFAYQCEKSGVNLAEKHEVLWYFRRVHFKKEDADGKELLLNFEGSDYRTKCWVDGVYLGVHEGGYTRFQFDIATEVAASKDGSVAIALEIEDTADASQPRGKQSWREKPWGCWYEETSGLWKSVWAESVNPLHIASLRYTPREDKIAFDVDYELSHYEPDCTLSFRVTYDGVFISESSFVPARKKGAVSLDVTSDLDGFKRISWSPAYPNLLEIEVSLSKDQKRVDHVNTYAGYRIFKAVKNLLVMNENPLYLRMVLEQGYFPASGMTYENDQQIRAEVQLIKDLGFNGVRMHQKIEDERFYYYCDVLGVVSSAEMPSFYEYRDSSLESVSHEWLMAVEELYNHPSICLWLPLNESWGVPDIRHNACQQNFSESLYHLTKALDPFRPVIANDGWEHTESDIITFHDYAQDPVQLSRFYDQLDAVLTNQNFVNYSQTRVSFSEGFHYEGQPVMIDEFAGIDYTETPHDGWGYGTVKTAEEFAARLSSLVASIVKNDRVCGFCVTQLTDVYIEKNGLLNSLRQPKIPVEWIRKAILQQ